MRRKKSRSYELTIESLSHEGRGVSHIDGKTIFVSNALPGEVVIAERQFSKANYEEAYAKEILKVSEDRINPKCEFFEVCGGCSFQYISSDHQIDIKFNHLQSLFASHQVNPMEWLKPLKVAEWGYRRKARLGVRYVKKKERVLVGFREKKSSFISDMSHCEVLHPLIGKNLNHLAECINLMDARESIPQIEVAIGEEETILVLRHLEEINDHDEKILNEYADKLNIHWYLQSGGIDTIKPLKKATELIYRHPMHDVEMKFLPTDFTQVNFEMNQEMVNLALSMLDLNQEDLVLDLFCGLGNFTLPIAKYAKHVVGVDGDIGLINRAKQNAISNEIENVEFFAANLFEDSSAFTWFRNKRYNKALIDPARTGAKEILPSLSKLGIELIVYVSCNPATLARDAKILEDDGYKVLKAGVMDMFPHTGHVESIALFKK
jgi:23S rRNA (uracil1939-C5)-methyltransferase